MVNAGGLWAREVGRMAGVELPIVPMEHQYIVTNDIPAVAALEREVAMCIDFDGESYLRQEGKGLLIGTYEHGCKHWAASGTPQDFAHELLPNDVDRIWSALEVAMNYRASPTAASSASSMAAWCLRRNNRSSGCAGSRTTSWLAG